MEILQQKFLLFWYYENVCWINLECEDELDQLQLEPRLIIDAISSTQQIQIV